MKPLSCEAVRRAVGGRWLLRGDGGRVAAVSTDSRTAKAGDLFFAIKGERFDGHRYLPQAAAAGCAAAVVRHDCDMGALSAGRFPGGLIGVDDTQAALARLGAHHRTLVRASVIAVTGSNGKTTVKRMIHHILSARLRGSCSPKSFNNILGVPLCLLGVAAEDDYVVCELGSNAPGEIALLAAICRPDLAVITSVGPTHLERLGSVEGVAAEKASILGSLTDGGMGIVNGDSPALAAALGRYSAPLVRFGASEGCRPRLTGFEPGGLRQRFQADGGPWADLSVPGRHNAINALAAIAVAGRYGFSLADAAGCLADFAGAEMRLQYECTGAVTIINDAYNCNPASLSAAASVLADHPAKRRVLVAGDMLELGEDAPTWHRRAGADLAALSIDLVIGVGALGGCIAKGAAAAGAATAAFDSVEDACRTVPGMLREGDVVLIKASRGAAMERLVGPLREAPAGRRSPSAASKGPHR